MHIICNNKNIIKEAEKIIKNKKILYKALNSAFLHKFRIVKKGNKRSKWFPLIIENANTPIM